VDSWRHCEEWGKFGRCTTQNGGADSGFIWAGDSAGHKMHFIIRMVMGHGPCTAPSPGWGPREHGPSENNWTDHVPSGFPDKNFGILGHFYFLVLIINACLHSRFVSNDSWSFLDRFL